MKKITIILFILFCSTCFAQKDSSFRLLKKIAIEATDLDIDNLDNLYILTNTDQLKKFNAAGDSVGVYNDVRKFGKLYSFDVSNPLKVVLFYKDFSSVVLLDRQLSVRNTVDLRKQNIIQASTVGISYDNNIWVFDAVENKLKKIDENGELLLETADFRTIFSENFVPQKIIDQDNSVYLFDSSYGVIQFDYYGSLQKKHALPRWQNIVVHKNNLIGILNNGFAVYNTSSLMQQQYQFPSSFGSFNQYIIGNTKLFTRSKDSVNIYSFRLY